jgi:hypothetical protein
MEEDRRLVAEVVRRAKKAARCEEEDCRTCTEDLADVVAAMQRRLEEARMEVEDAREKANVVTARGHCYEEAGADWNLVTDYGRACKSLSDDGVVEARNALLDRFARLRALLKEAKEEAQRDAAGGGRQQADEEARTLAALRKDAEESCMLLREENRTLRLRIASLEGGLAAREELPAEVRVLDMERVFVAFAGAGVLPPEAALNVTYKGAQMLKMSLLLDEQVIVAFCAAEHCEKENNSE